MKKFILSIFVVLAGLLALASCAKGGNTYKIRFLQYDESVLWETNVQEGNQIVYGGTVPTRAADQLNTYVFAGWDHEPGKATKNEDFVAQYTATPNGSGGTPSTTSGPTPTTTPSPTTTPQPTTTSGGGSQTEDLVDVLTHTSVGGNGKNSYQDWTYEGESGAVYTACTAFGNNAIQLRSKNSDAAIVCTTSAGTVKKVEVKFNSNTFGTRKLGIFGFNDEVDGVESFYEEGLSPVKEFVYEKSSGVLEFSYDFTDTFTYIALASTQDALYLDEIKITWTSGSAVEVLPADQAFVDAVAASSKTNVTINYQYKGGSGYAGYDSESTFAYANGVVKYVYTYYDTFSEEDVEVELFFYEKNGVKYVIFYDDGSYSSDYDDFGDYFDYFSKKRLNLTEDGAWYYVAETDPLYETLVYENNFYEVELPELNKDDFEKTGEKTYRAKADKVDEIAKSILGDADDEGDDVDFYGEPEHYVIKETFTKLYIEIDNGKIVKITAKSNYSEEYTYEDEENNEKTSGTFAYTVTFSKYGTTTFTLPEASVYISDPKIETVYELNDGDTISLVCYVNAINRAEGVVYICDETGAIAALCDNIDENLAPGDVVDVTATVKVTGKLYELVIAEAKASEEYDSTTIISLPIETLKDTDVTYAGEFVDFGFLEIKTLDVENKNVVFKGYDELEYKLIFIDSEKQKVASLFEGKEVGKVINLKKVIISYQDDAFTIRLTDDTDLELQNGLIATETRFEAEAGSNLDNIFNELNVYSYNEGVKTTLAKTEYEIDVTKLNNNKIGSYLAYLTYGEEKISLMVKIYQTGEVESFVEDDGKGISFMYEAFNANYGVKSTGDVEILVIPVSFTNVTVASNYKDVLEKGFNGTAEETGWESLSSYYYKSSYGKLNLHATILDAYQTGDPYYAKEQEVGRKSYPNDYLEGYSALDYKYLDKAIAHYDSEIDFSNYDSNNDGYIDTVFLVYLAPYATAEGSMDLWWAYNYLYYEESDEEVKYDDLGLCYYMWLSYNFFTDELKNVKVNAETVIHETGHALGLDDYYDTSNDHNGGAGGGMMMDQNVGDHDPYSKALLGWIEPTIVINKDTEVTIGSFESTGDAIFIAKDYDGIYYNEYIIVDLYTPTGLNELEAGSSGLPTIPGVRIIHVNATPKGEVVDSIWEVTKASNSTTDNMLITIVQADGSNSIIEGGQMSNTDLFKQGDVLSEITWADGTKINFTVTVKALSNTSATIVIDFE